MSRVFSNHFVVTHVLYIDTESRKWQYFQHIYCNYVSKRPEVLSPTKGPQKLCIKWETIRSSNTFTKLVIELCSSNLFYKTWQKNLFCWYKPLLLFALCRIWIPLQNLLGVADEMNLYVDLLRMVAFWPPCKRDIAINWPAYSYSFLLTLRVLARGNPFSNNCSVICFRHTKQIIEK